MEGMADTYPGKLQLWEGWMSSLVSGATAGRAAARRARTPSRPAYSPPKPCRPAASRARRPNRSPCNGSWKPRASATAVTADGCRACWNSANTPAKVCSAWATASAPTGCNTPAAAPSSRLAARPEDTLALVRRNFELRGLAGQFVHADPAGCRWSRRRIDVVCVEQPAPHGARPGRAGRGSLSRPQAGRQGAGPDAGPLRRRLLEPPAASPGAAGSAVRRRPDGGISRRGLRRLFVRFTEHRIYKRHLRRSETPHLLRWLPLPLLERLMGRFLVLKAFKPLSAAMSLQSGGVEAMNEGFGLTCPGQQKATGPRTEVRGPACLEKSRRRLPARGGRSTQAPPSRRPDCFRGVIRQSKPSRPPKPPQARRPRRGFSCSTYRLCRLRRTGANRRGAAKPKCVQ